MPPETYDLTLERLSVEPAQGEPAPVYRGRRRRDPDVEPQPEPFPPASHPPAEQRQQADATIELPAVQEHANWPVEPVGFEQWAQSLLGEQWQTSERVHDALDAGVDGVEDFIEDFIEEPQPPCLVVAPPQFLTRAEAKAAAAARDGRYAGSPRTASAQTSSRRAAAANVRRAPQRRLIEPALQPIGVRRYRGLTAAAALATVGAIGGVGMLVDGALSNDASGQAAASIGGAPVTEAAAVRGTEQALGAARGGSTASLTVVGPGANEQIPQMTAKVRVPPVPQIAVNERAFRMVAVSRSQERGPISGCSGKPPAKQFANGQIPSSALCAIPFASGHKLRADAAVRLIRLNEVYRGEFGVNLCLTDSYRSLSSQYSVAARKPGLAARPGTSEHGWGLAIDMCDGPDVPGSAHRAWMLKHAPEFGWDNPDWARPGTGSKPEPWHWEFLEGEK